MDLQNEKCVMVIDETLPAGLIANTAGIMGITLGKEMPDTVGPDVTDKTGCSHRGIIQFPVPVLKADGAKIRELREQRIPDGKAVPSIPVSSHRQPSKQVPETE